jgi:hypothetical protein
VNVNLNGINCGGGPAFFFGDISNPTNAIVIRPEGIATVLQGDAC